jgi:hypothetical protein
MSAGSLIDQLRLARQSPDAAANAWNLAISGSIKLFFFSLFLLEMGGLARLR